jgi:cell wall-associated NlpC family hydrolase
MLDSDFDGIVIPEGFFEVEYQSSRIPGVAEQSDLSLGANCQLFAYALLRANGLSVPNFRSSELWCDDRYSERVTQFEPLDLMLYSDAGEAWGAHVGVYLGDGKIIHLSLENGRPQVIAHAAMLQIPRYAKFVGAKRIKRQIS